LDADAGRAILERVLQIESLSVRYGELTAIDGISASVRPGLTGLLGPNGAGKSTLMRTLATLQEPSSGSVRWTLADGRRLQLGTDDATWRTRLGYLPQDFGLYPTLSVRETIDHFAALKGFGDARSRRAEVDRQLERVRLDALVDRPASALSGGMRQRVGIAIALIGRPELLIIDEPTSGLDPDERASLLHLLASIAGSAIVLVSTHLVDDVEALCDRVLLLDRGRLLVDSTPDAAIAALIGRVWQFSPSPGELQSWRRSSHLLRERLYRGAPVLRVLADQLPAVGAESVAPTLDDLYAMVVRRVIPFHSGGN
jgi:ABC-2 type transport system ATP-binding protein